MRLVRPTVGLLTVVVIIKVVMLTFIPIGTVDGQSAPTPSHTPQPIYVDLDTLLSEKPYEDRCPQAESYNTELLPHAISEIFSDDEHQGLDVEELGDLMQEAGQVLDIQDDHILASISLYNCLHAPPHHPEWSPYLFVFDRSGNFWQIGDIPLWQMYQMEDNLGWANDRWYVYVFNSGRLSTDAGIAHIHQVDGEWVLGDDDCEGYDCLYLVGSNVSSALPTVEFLDDYRLIHRQYDISHPWLTDGEESVLLVCDSYNMFFSYVERYNNVYEWGNDGYELVSQDRDIELYVAPQGSPEGIVIEDYRNFYNFEDVEDVDRWEAETIAVKEEYCP